MLARPLEHGLDRQVFQAKRILLGRAQDHSFGLHTTRLESIFVKQDELIRAFGRCGFVPQQFLWSHENATSLLGVESHDGSPPRCSLLCLSLVLHPS